jgi:hypothetical protein
MDSYYKGNQLSRKAQENGEKMGTVLFSSASQDSRWKGDDGFEKVEDSVDRDAEESKGQ